MLRLAAFADEISPDLDEQIRVCRECGVSHFELRGVYGRNVLDLDAGVRGEVKRRLADHGMGVACVGSPVGKVKVSDPWAAHFDRFKIAVDAAEFFDAPLIRLFSYYPPEHGQDMSRHRDEVVRRMRAKVEYVQDRPVTLVHENEKDIYGDTGARCLHLLTAVGSPKLRAAFDFANFIQCNDKPLEVWPALKPYAVHIHIKDASARDGRVVPAGHGDGHIGVILKDAYASGYRGFLSLEPHLAAAGQFAGFSGPQLFKEAVAALRQVCKDVKVPLATTVG